MLAERLKEARARALEQLLFERGVVMRAGLASKSLDCNFNGNNLDMIIGLSNS